jgi:hypothetical protein
MGHEFFSVSFEAELPRLTRSRVAFPLLPALLTMGMLLQAYDPVGKADVA